MKNSQLGDARLLKIENVLANDLRLTKASSLRTLLKDPNPSYLMRPDLRAARHFDFHPDVLVHDRELAVLGFINLVTTPRALEEQVEKLIDECAYMRHLLLADKGLGDALPYSVELVIVAEPIHVQAASNVLGRTVRQSHLLQAIGVNFLWPDPVTGEFEPKEIRRSFAWLLRHTRRWYSEYARKSSQDVRRPTHLTLNNYRLAGERKLELKSGSRFHVVHGYNGSGKSSLAEAIELAVTGSVERLASVHDVDYGAVIRHERSSAPAQITIGYERGDPFKVEVKSHGLDAHIKKALNSASFRLDHTVMDRLTRGSDAERAEIFLGAFFPEDASAYREFHQGRQAAYAALSRLPLDLQLQDSKSVKDTQELTDRLNETVRLMDTTPGQTIAPEVLDRWLPRPLSDLKMLSALSPALDAAVAKLVAGSPTPEQLPSLLDELNRELEPLIPTLGEKLVAIRRARAALDRLQGWVVSEQVEDGEDPVRILNSWLELCALTDIAQKQLQISLILKDLDETMASPTLSYEVGSGLFGQPTNPQQLAALRSRAELWRESRDDYFSRLESTRRESRPRVASPSIPRPQLSTAEIRSLNEVSPWLSLARRESFEEPFGQVVLRALGDGRYRKLGSITIGQANWEQVVATWLEDLQKACEDLRERSSADRLNLIQDLLSRAAAFQKAQGRLEKTFLQRIGVEGEDEVNLQAALNEVTSLFTPARWAYDRVRFSPKSESDSTEVVLETGEEEQKTRAEIRLNTAELNLFVLGLFLLCAVRMDNPLFLLVLDDPFQNMDELTMTFVSRGLGKIGRLLPDPWQILILLHGEDTLNRLSSEIPATIHRLPWLTPDQEGVEDPQKIESRAGKSNRVQDLALVLKRGPRRRGGAQERSEMEQR